MNNQSLFEICKTASLHSSDNLFIRNISSSQDVTYGKLFIVIKKFIMFCNELNLKNGNRIAYISKNHWLLFPMLISCASKGYSLIPINSDLHISEIKNILEKATPRIVVYESVDVEKIKANENNTLFIKMEELSNLINNTSVSVTENSEKISSTPSEKATLIIYTSGTTGSSKAVILSEKNLVEMAFSLSRSYKISKEDKFLSVLPLYHMNGIMITGLLPLVSGASVVCSELFSYTNAKRYWKIAYENSVTIISIVPSIMSILIKYHNKDSQVGNNNLRFAFCGAAPLSSNLWKAFEETFAISVYQGYGLTETTTWSTCTPYEQKNKNYSSVGMPLNCEIIIDKMGRNIDLLYDRRSRMESAEGFEDQRRRRRAEDDSPIGEILIHGPSVMMGYAQEKLSNNIKYSEMNKECFFNGYFKTGDIGYFDENGLLHVCGRIKEIIIRAGDNINPSDIDDVLVKHSDVLEAKTIGVPDANLGEAIYTLFIKKEGAKEIDKMEMRRWLLERISKSKFPDKILEIKQFPKTSTGKISINILKKLFLGNLSKEIISKLTTWKFKRATPNMGQLEAIIQKHLEQGGSIPFVMYWGCGKRDNINKYDQMAIERLFEMLNNCNYSSSHNFKLTIIFTDIHARLNRKPHERYFKYFSAIEDCLKSTKNNNIETIMLSKVWKLSGFDEGALEDMINNWHRDEKDKYENNLELKKGLIESAKKHFEGDLAERAAFSYYIACQHDKIAVKELFNDNIFLTYNGPSSNPILPDLAKIYMYSFKKNVTDKPWFMNEEEDEFNS